MNQTGQRRCANGEVCFSCMANGWNLAKCAAKARFTAVEVGANHLGGSLHDRSISLPVCSGEARTRVQNTGMCLLATGQ